MARHIDIHDQPEEALVQAVSMLEAGFPVAIPTETVYGLAADATNPAAITRIYETKGRPQFNPLICHMASLDMAEEYAIFDPVSRRLAEAFWPGPLTLILPLKPDSRIHALATATTAGTLPSLPAGWKADSAPTRSAAYATSGSPAGSGYASNCLACRIASTGSATPSSTATSRCTTTLRRSR